MPLKCHFARAFTYMDTFSILFSILLILLGSILGYYLNILQNQQTSKESEGKHLEQSIKSLLQELEFNYSILKKGMSTKKSLGGTEYDWFRGSLQSKSYESIVHSGNLTDLPPEIQISVSFYYEKLEELNYIGNETMPGPIGNPSENVSYQNNYFPPLWKPILRLKKPWNTRAKILVDSKNELMNVNVNGYESGWIGARAFFIVSAV